MKKDQQLTDAVNSYFAALHNCDIVLFDRAFHPSASLFDADEGALNVEPIAQFRTAVADRQSPASVGQTPEYEIISVDWLSDLSASVKVRIRIHANIFVDHLLLVSDGDLFRIVAKVWHLEAASVVQ